MSEWKRPSVSVDLKDMPDHLGSEWVCVSVTCDECGYTSYTAGPKSYKWEHLIDHHLDQHAPYRALDIDVCWEVSADCSVCEDGGEIVEEDGGLTCRKCGAYWDIDGTGGTREEVSE